MADKPTVGIAIEQVSVKPGEPVRIWVTRGGDFSIGCAVTWEATASDGKLALVGWRDPTVYFGPGDTSCAFDFVAAGGNGRGSHAIEVELTGALSCTIDPENKSDKVGVLIIEKPDEPDEPVKPPPATDGWPKRTIVADKTFVGAFTAKENHEYVRCTFGGKDVPWLEGRMPKNVRFTDCIVKDITLQKEEGDPGGPGGHIIYINNGHPEVEIGLVFKGLRIVNCKSPNFAEFKASDVSFIGCTQEESCKFGQTLRFRHGKRHIVTGCKGFGEIAARGWLKWFVNNTGSKVVLWAGKMPARYDQWKPLHEGEGGKNWQCTELAYVEKCGSVYLGKASYGEDKFPAKNCPIDPSQGAIVEGKFVWTKDGTWHRHLDSFAELEAMA